MCDSGVFTQAGEPSGSAAIAIADATPGRTYPRASLPFKNINVFLELVCKGYHIVTIEGIGGLLGVRPSGKVAQGREALGFATPCICTVISH